MQLKVSQNIPSKARRTRTRRTKITKQFPDGRRRGRRLRAPNSGSGACTRSAWRWARSSGSFGTSAEPGESVQVDVKFVKIAGRWAFQYTALDDCTRRRLPS